MKLAVEAQVQGGLGAVKGHASYETSSESDMGKSTISCFAEVLGGNVELWKWGVAPDEQHQWKASAIKDSVITGMRLQPLWTIGGLSADRANQLKLHVLMESLDSLTDMMNKRVRNNLLITPDEMDMLRDAMQKVQRQSVEDRQLQRAANALERADGRVLNKEALYKIILKGSEGKNQMADQNRCQQGWELASHRVFESDKRNHESSWVMVHKR